MKIYTPASVIGGCAAGFCHRLSASASRKDQPESPEQQIKRLSSIAFHPSSDGKTPDLHAALERLWNDMHDEMLQRCSRGEFSCAEEAVRCVSGELSALLQSSGDTYLRARAEDISAIGEQMLAHLSDMKISLPCGCVLVADRISVFEAMEALHCGAAAIIVKALNPLSHAALMLRGSGIPLAYGFQNLEPFSDGVFVLVDGKTGCVAIDPDESMFSTSPEAAPSPGKIQLSDGSALTVALNCCGSWEPLPAGAEIGLLRTEFFVQFLEHLPSEDALTWEYERILSRNPRTDIRLFDAGGDKPMPGLIREAELSWDPQQRGIALLLRQRSVLRLQLRAILRAAVRGEARILIPMLDSPAQVEAVRACLNECAAELTAAGAAHRSGLALGAMIETPEAVKRADEIARCADFAALGTNDLICQVMGVSRTDAHMPEPNPHVFDLIRRCADAFRRAEKPLCVCGDLAADPVQARRLISLGIRRISVPCAAVRQILDSLAEEPLQI